MDPSRLFKVLVVGGALLVAGCDDDEGGGDREGPPGGGADASPGAVADASPADRADGGELAPCFCDVEACCARDEDGVGTLQDGFECCWSTTC